MRDPVKEWPVYLEDAEGNRLPVRGSCSLGRSASNQVAVPDQTVSRRHAVIQAQGEQEYWLVDFGSSNGTYLNGQRIARPTRLSDGDALRIGGVQYVFRQDEAARRGLTATLLSDKTVMDVRSLPCWLLVADIINSTKLTTELPPDELARVVGQWLAECKETIEQRSGRINQFLGDGFFAFWQDREEMEMEVEKAIQALRRLQLEHLPAFRFVLHLGHVMLGGMAVGEEESLTGGEVHFVFRMEKLAGSLGELRLLSEPARNRLASMVQTKSIKRHRLQGFERKFAFYAF